MKARILLVQRNVHDRAAFEVMALTDLDHNHYPIDHPGRSPTEESIDVHPQRLPAFQPSQDAQSLDEAAFYLPATTYTNAARSRRSKLSLSTDLGGRPVDPCYAQATGPAAAEGASPDPHEYYRQLHDPFAARTVGHSSQKAEIKPARVNSTSTKKSTLSTVRSNGAISQATLGPDIRQPYPLSRSPPYREGALVSARPNPSLASLVRPRQASFQDLVAKFDRRGGSQSAHPKIGAGNGSRNMTSATSSASGGGSSRNVSPTMTKGISIKSAARKPSQGSADSSTSKTNHGTYQASTNGRRSFDMSSTQKASQSLTNLGATNGRTSKRPLFGEIVPATSDKAAFLHGMSYPGRRRGSVDSPIHSPNPMFPHSSLEFDSPSTVTSPDAWYRNFDPISGARHGGFLDGEKESPHRRAQSDVSTIPSSYRIAPLQYQNVIHVASAAEPPRASPTTSSISNPPSRIPVRRRHSHASDSATSAPSSRATSILAHYHTNQEEVSVGKKASSRSAQDPVSPRRTVISPIPTKSSTKTPVRRDRNRTAPQDQKSPSLRANIIAPPPKVSPPLRSSRPRLPISAASTSSSRARTIDRLASFPKPSQDGPPPTARLRRPPELDNVDLEARRRKITQAFNKTIRENAQKEKVAADRRRMVREKAQADEAARQNESARTVGSTDVTQDPQPTCAEAAQEDNGDGDGDVFQTPSEGFRVGETSVEAPSILLSVMGSSMTDRRSVDGNDSPTLGRPTEFRHGSLRSLSGSHAPSEGNDLPPLSAVTADTDGTTFDNEPQIEPPESTLVISRTVLSQIMDMRESSPPASLAMSENGSEQADKESVQIVLQNNSYFDPSESPRQEPGREDGNRRSFLNDEMMEQWSTSSWTSSIRDRSSLEGPLEPIIEKSPNLHHQPTECQSPSASGLEDDIPEAHSTAEADAYVSVSRVLKNKHSAGGVNANHFGDIYQKILEQSPDLARQGGWDTQRVTQLCLQEIDRSKYERLSKVSSPDKKKQEVMAKAAASPGPKTLTPEKAVPGHHYRASLNNADDFAFTSPSIVDWMQFAAADSPTDEGQDIAPPLPPKDLGASLTEGALIPGAENANSISRLGLNIHLVSPIKSPLSRTPPLRPPSHSPPPPPQMSRSIAETTDSTTPVNSPGVYGNGPAPSVSPHKPFLPQPPQVPRRITSLSRMASPSNSTEALIASSKNSISAPPGSSIDQRPSLEQSAVELVDQTASPSPEQKKVNRRKHVIKELVDTEASFGRDMSVVDDIYKGTSSSCLDLAPEDIRILFGNSAQIVKFSLDFLDSLKAAAKSIYTVPKSQRFQSKRTSRAASASTVATTASDELTLVEMDEVTDLEKDQGTYIGDAFKSNLAEMEKVYTIYLKNHDAANRKLQALQQNQTVEIWLNECRQWASDLTNAWDLDSLLVKPVQRLLKYPLFLTQLLELTAEDHPDHQAIRDAMHDLTEVSIRINDMKKHSELVEQGLKRNRKESDVRMGLSKAIGRKTEKLKQNVGVSKIVEDREYILLRERYSDNQAHLVLVREDVKMYIIAATKSTQRFNELALAIDGWIDVGHTAYPEKESRWRQFGMIVRDLVTVAVPEHVATIQKVVIDPMAAAAKMLEALLKDPKGLIQKRDKKSIDYARWKNSKDRGEKLDKKAVDRMEEWEALNREAKGRMAKLIDLTGDLAQGCLKNFVQIQCTWLMIWQHKLSVVIEAMTSDISKITKEWQEDFDHHEAQALMLGICNGSLLAEAVNLLPFATPASTFDGTNSPRHPSWIGPGKRSFSVHSDGSPKPSTEFTSRHSGSFSASPMAESYDRSHHSLPSNRMRAISTASGPTSASELALRNGSMTSLHSPAGLGSSLMRPSTSTGGSSDFRSTRPPRLSLDAPSPTIGTIRIHTTSARPDSGSTFYSANGNLAAPITATTNSGSSMSPSPIPRPIDIFSSALPMTDSPMTATPSTINGGEDRRIDVLFLAASVYEFNIDRSRREAGFPYLTYVTGEIFDVIAERGELWLARNQDDAEKQVGWIWNKHFAKLAET